MSIFLDNKGDSYCLVSDEITLAPTALNCLKQLEMICLFINLLYTLLLNLTRYVFLVVFSLLSINLIVGRVS